MKVMKLWELMFWNSLSWEGDSLVISKVRLIMTILDTIEHLLLVLVSPYSLRRNLDSYPMAEVRWGESCSTHLNFSWIFIHLIVALCLLIFPKWLDFPEWEACSKWKEQQRLECLTLYKLSPKVGSLALENRAGFWKDQVDQKTQGLSGIFWLIPVLLHSKADEISLLLFRFPGRVQVFINQLTTEPNASTFLLKFEFLLQGRVS